MNRRLFFMGGFSIFALARMAHGSGDSQFFKGDIHRVLPAILGVSEVVSVPGLVRDAKFGIWRIGVPVCSRAGRLVRAEYVHSGFGSI